MKSVFFRSTGSIDQIQVGELAGLADRQLLKGQLRLRLLSAALNHLDLWVLKGLPGVKYQNPHVMGADAVAEVLESGSDEFKSGERVLIFPAVGTNRDEWGCYQAENESRSFGVRGETAPGVLQEELILSAVDCMPCPEHLSDYEAAAIPLTYLTAWQMLVEKAQLQPVEGELAVQPIVVFAAGSGVTHALTQLLQSFGFKKIAVTSRSEKKLETYQLRGFHTVLDNEHLESNIKKWAKPNRVSFVFDHLGGAYASLAARVLKSSGTYVSCGSTTTPHAEIDWRHLFFRQLQFLGSTMGSRRAFHQMIYWIEHKKLRPEVSRVFKFTEAQQAYRELDAALQNGKIVLDAMQSLSKT